MIKSAVEPLITEYLPEANGNFIKVYFYMLFLSKYNKEIKLLYGGGVSIENIDEILKEYKKLKHHLHKKDKNLLLY